MNDFYFNEDFLYVVGNNNSCQSIFVNSLFEIKQNINKYLDIICKLYGSSLKGRVDASNYLLKKSYKCPIIISDRLNIILFNIKEENNEYWINYKQIINIEYKMDKVLIYFKNNKKLLLKLSKFKINYQITKSVLLEKSLFGKNY